MTTTPTEGITTVLHPVSDLEKAKAVYTALLGQAPQHDASYYVGYDVAGQHIGLVPGGGRLVAAFTDPDGNVLGLTQDR
jgi:catechol 2,3-dioxygenase-like lactoylglutathione lyase family enzyme